MTRILLLLVLSQQVAPVSAVDYSAPNDLLNCSSTLKDAQNMWCTTSTTSSVTISATNGARIVLSITNPIMRLYLSSATV